jgi:hypothetical protein
MEAHLTENHEEFLLDTLEYYSADVNRRCTDSANLFSGCKYSPFNVGKVGVSEGCAIGRHMTPKNQKLADGCKNANIGYIFKTNPKLIPSKLRSLGVEFLTRVQRLHDSDENWCKDGISRKGAIYVKSMVNEFNLSPDKFRKYLVLIV